MIVLCGFVMHHGSVFLIAADCRERKIQITGNLTSQMIQILRCGKLRNLCFSHILFQPVNEFTYGCAVFQIDFFHLRKFYFVFYRLHFFRRILAVHCLCFFRECFIKRIACVSAVIKYFAGIAIICQEICHFMIIVKYNSVFFCSLFQRIRHFTVLDKQMAFFHRKKGIGKSYRITLHITSADIQHPHDIVKFA